MKQRLDSDSVKEALSALADNEHSDVQQSQDEIIELACSDPEIRRAWQSMHLTRDVLQADYNSALDANFASKLSLMIDQEEAHTADNVVSFAAARSGRSERKQQAKPIQTAPFAVWKPVVGLGLAASLAGASFLFSQLWEANQPTQAGSAQVAANSAETNNVNTAISTDSRFASFTSSPAAMDDVGTRWRMESERPRNEDVEKRLNALLTNHLEDASMGVGVQGMLSHSRVVGYDSAPDNKEDQ